MALIIYVLIFVIIPAICFASIRSVIAGYFLTSTFGAISIVARMIYLEAHAVDKEFDFIFFVSIFIWAFVVFLLYLPYGIVAHLLKKRLKGAP